MNRVFFAALSLALLALSAGARAEEARPVSAPEPSFEDLLQGATMPLETAIQKGERKGMPVSGAIERQKDGIFTTVVAERTGRWTRIVFATDSGKVLEIKTLTDNEARVYKESREIMGKAHLALSSGVKRALRANPGWRAVKGTPELKDGHPYAKVELLKGKDRKTESVKLD